MNREFKRFVNSLEPSFRRLMASDAVTVPELPRDMPGAGIYLFSEGERHLYVGRSNTIRKHLQKHCRPSSGHNSATFAFRLAREETGQLTASYVQDGSRKYLEKDSEFGPVFVAQKERVRRMGVRYVEESDPMRQALLEMYVAVSLGAPYNVFDNH